jgi:octanoyl-[GcvH]:protein N-octanoyltransferase
MNKNKLLRYTNVPVATIFAKEKELINKLQENIIEQCLILWQTNEATLVLPSSTKWPQSDCLKKGIQAEGWQLLSRQTGGAPVPQCKGIINLSHLYLWPDTQPYSIKLAYENLCTVLIAFFAKFSLTSETHPTPFSYCDGEYNLNINGKKIVGTALRVINKKEGGRIILAQAFILIDVLLEELIKPVNLCYQLSDRGESVLASAHTSLFQQTQERPSVDQLYQQLTQAFIESKLY